MTESWHGIFTIPFTPFHDDRSLDEESLRREVDFVIEAGAHGIVAPVNSSEFYLLSDEERRCQGEPKFPQLWELKIPHPVCGARQNQSRFTR